MDTEIKSIKLNDLFNKNHYAILRTKITKLLNIVLNKAKSIYQSNLANLDTKMKKLKNSSSPKIKIKDEDEDFNDLEVVNEFPKKNKEDLMKRKKEFVNIIKDSKIDNLHLNKDKSAHKLNIKENFDNHKSYQNNILNEKYNSNNTKSILLNVKQPLNEIKKTDEISNNTKSILLNPKQPLNEFKMTKEDNNKQIFKMLLNKINSLELKQNYFIRSLEIEKKNNKKLNNNTNSEANFQNKTLSNKIENTQHEKQINVNEKLKQIKVRMMKNNQFENENIEKLKKKNQISLKNESILNSTDNLKINQNIHSKEIPISNRNNDSISSSIITPLDDFPITETVEEGRHLNNKLKRIKKKVRKLINNKKSFRFKQKSDNKIHLIKDSHSFIKRKRKKQIERKSIFQ